MIGRSGIVRWMLPGIGCVVALAGCAARRPELTGPPPIPPRRGALVIDVVYPRDSALIAAPDSNFIFGSVGNGEAALTINGHDVPVEYNGAFLAWLPVPGAPGDTLADYRLVATLGGREVRAVHTIRRLRAGPLLPPDSLGLDTASLSPRGAWWVREGEVVQVGARATSGARVRLILPDGAAVPLAEVAGARPGPAASSNQVFGRVPRGPDGPSGATGTYRGDLVARSPLGRGWLRPGLLPVPADLSGVATYCAQRNERNSSEAVADTVASEAGRAAPELAPPGCAVLEVTLAGDTLRMPLPLDLWIVEEPGPMVELREEPSATGRDGFVVGRAAPGGTTLWMWTDGVRARVTGRRNGSVRLALDELTEAWVALDELVWLRGAAPASRARVGTVRLAGLPDRVRVRVAVSQPVPYHVESDGRRISLTLYGAYSGTDWLRYGPADEFVRAARWEQVTSDRYVLRLELAGRPWGYRARYEAGGLTLEIRKPPAVDPGRPLAGLSIAVDPGHPPAGATGPTRLYEGDANLAVAYRLKRLLEEEGARVIMTRTDRSPVRLYDRTHLAELLDAHVLVSIHNNALPDGVRPFDAHGTSVYYFHAQSLDLARALQRGLLESMGLSDLGIGRASLALARPAWMPAALTEGAFMMIPAQEAGLRDPAFQEAYARGVLEGLRAFVLGRLE